MNQHGWATRIGPGEIDASGSFAEALGDLIKSYERVETNRCVVPGQPLVARLDGRGFTKLTRGLQRPFDDIFIGAMNDTMIDLVDNFNAVLGFCQSDEITLVFLDRVATDEEQRVLPFNGKLQKLCSVLAGRASAKLTLALSQTSPTIAARIPTFDCRLFNVPDRDAAALSLYWRHLDARKNSVLMHAAGHFSHREMDGKTQVDLRRMCREANVPWEDVPERLKNGRYCRRTKYLKALTEEELSRIPAHKRPTGPVERSRVELFDPGPLGAMANLPDVVFLGAQATYLTKANGADEG